jgi:hypothetical protein
MDFKKIFNVPFGKITDGSVQTSFGINGIALAAKDKDGNLRSYNVADKNISIVPADLTFGDFPAYVIPVDSTKLVEGDLILNGKDLAYYSGKDEDGNSVVVDIKTAELKTLVPTKSAFGFNFVAKVMSPLSGIAPTTPADGSAPAFDPQMLILMSALGGDGDLFDGDDGMLPLLLLTGGFGGKAGANPFGDMTSNPLMLMFLMKSL